MNVRAVLEHGWEQGGGGGAGIDRAAIAETDQAREQAGMIEVRMGEQDEIQRAHIEVQRGKILAIGVAAALEHAAIDQEAA